MAGVTLNPIPDAGHDLEHYVAALCQAAGYFVEKNLIERSPGDVLELDMVVSDYSGDTPASTLIEAKGGGWGWSDLFKMLGWMTYLGMPRGVLLAASTNDKPIESMCAKLGPFGVHAASFEGFADPKGTFAAAGFTAPADDAHVALWRHSFSIERKLVQRLAEYAKANPAMEGPSAAVTYQRLVNDGTFFARTSVQRLCMLYDAYKDHPKLTLACAEELAGHGFDPHLAPTTNQYLIEALREGKHELLQATMFLEHRGRLALLQAAIDYACIYPDGPPTIMQGEVNWTDLLYHSLPNSFHEGIAWLRQQSHFRRYAVFWQQLLWGWGGFYLDHRQAEEFEWMAACTGVPVEQIPSALSAFDRLFPLQGGWITTVGPSSAMMVKMVPTYFKGLGAHHRRHQYGIIGTFGSIGGAQYTGHDLARWNNAAVEFLLHG